MAESIPVEAVEQIPASSVSGSDLSPEMRQFLTAVLVVTAAYGIRLAVRRSVAAISGGEQ